MRFFVSDILSYDVHFTPCYWNRWLQDFVVFKQCLVEWLCMDMTSSVTHGWIYSETLRSLHDEWRVSHAFSTMSYGDYQCNSHDILRFLSQCKKNKIRYVFLDILHTAWMCCLYDITLEREVTLLLVILKITPVNALYVFIFWSENFNIKVIIFVDTIF